ncbi:hypothetical protein [Metabacillus fastidiosus]|uniref:hypothetical protein n=1 Tax=Metabacillus fastidiosus TaxID=1458 RepID=UPI002E213970|nr:hypothetical protein [Metabacillus fastidiosus]
MSYSFNIRTTNYEWISVFNNFYKGELNQYSEKHLNLRLMLQNLFIKSKEAFAFANELYSIIPNDGTELYEEVDFKLSNCRLYMEYKFDEKAQELLNGIQFSEDTYERYVEILNAYTDVTIRGYEEIMKDTLSQVERIVTGISGLLDDLQFTLELNGMFALRINKKSLPELLTVNHLADNKIRKETPELTFIDKDLKDLICA